MPEREGFSMMTSSSREEERFQKLLERVVFSPVKQEKKKSLRRNGRDERDVGREALWPHEGLEEKSETYPKLSSVT